MRLGLVVSLALGLVSGCTTDSNAEGRTASAAEISCATRLACNRDIIGALEYCATEAIEDPALRACIVAARGSCDAIDACAGVTWETTPCSPRSTGCEGNVIWWCDERGERRASRACPADAECIESSTAFCHRRRCTQDVCSGDTIVRCDSGLDPLEYPSEIRCPEGTTCDEGAPIRCVPDPPLPSCVGETRCEDEVAVQCAGGLETSRTDCAATGLHCVLGAERARCLGPVTECEYADSRCEGDTLFYCGTDQAWHPFHCPTYGFLGCEERAYEYAACIPRP